MWRRYWAAAVCEYGIDPEAAWRLSTQEFWALHRWKNGGEDTKPKVQPMSRERFEEMKRMYPDG